jgi:hypothetical protein
MPFPGKLIVGTILATAITGTVTVQAYKDSVANSSYQLSVTGSGGDQGQTQDWKASPLSFSAGSMLTFYQSAAPTSATAFTVTFYVIFN